MSFRNRSGGRHGEPNAQPPSASAAGQDFTQLDRSRSLLELLNASVKRIEPSGRVSVSRYISIGNQLLKKADEYRKEGNVEQLYVMLMRFASLMVETLPKHPEHDPKDKQFAVLKRKLVDIYFPELEKLQDAVRRRDPNPEYADSASELLGQYKLEAMEADEEAEGLERYSSADYGMRAVPHDVQRQNSAPVGS